MEHFKVSSKIGVLVSPVFKATYDKEADFDQVVLRVRNGEKFVNFRVTDLGDAVTIEFNEGFRLSHNITLKNDAFHGAAFQTMMDNFLA